MNEQQYRAADGINYSRLKKINRSPKDYKEDTGRLPSQDVLDLGQALHMAILEPYRFDMTVVPFTGKVRRGKDWEAFKAEHEGKIILKASDYQNTLDMASAVFDNPRARALVEAEGVCEQPVFWEDPETGLLLKCKPDKHLYGQSVTEVKSTMDASPWNRAFPAQSASLFYHVQAAMYVVGCEAKEHHTIAVDKSSLESVVYRTTQDKLDIVTSIMRKWLNQVAECTKADHWPGVDGDKVIDLTLPPWAIPDDDNDDVTLDEEGIDFDD